jgi:hypothetical protein
MYALQLQNIKRETIRKIPVHQLDQTEKNPEFKEKEEKEEDINNENTTKIEDLVESAVFEVKTEN